MSTFELNIPGVSAAIVLGSGTTTIFVGANGTGKTRLAVKIEELLGVAAHRISAHRALILNPLVPKISEDLALKGLRYGHADPNGQIAHKHGSRWHGKEATSLLSDFDFVLQALFAEQTNTALKTHYEAHAGTLGTPPKTKFQELAELWHRVLPHRRLVVTGDDVRVAPGESGQEYSASEMSDGERGIFYLIGQTLLAADDSVLIVDEPELHVHRAVMIALWETLIAKRADCAFVFITHDLDFAAALPGSKYVLRGYALAEGWSIEAVPFNTGFSEELTTLILGSRRPVLFVEGAHSSLDATIYNASYPDHTVVPRGSCETVIRSVRIMNENAAFTRIKCSGIVDADSVTEPDREWLRGLDVHALPVSEVENLLLMPHVTEAILQTEGYENTELKARQEQLSDKIFEIASNEGKVERAVIRACSRRIDSRLKRVDLSEAKTVDEVEEVYRRETAAIKIDVIASEVRHAIYDAIQKRDRAKLLMYFDDKGLLAIAAPILRGNKRDDFESWLSRELAKSQPTKLLEALRGVVPKIAA